MIFAPIDLAKTTSSEITLEGPYASVLALFQNVTYTCKSERGLIDKRSERDTITGVQIRAGAVHIYIYILEKKTFLKM